MTPAKSTRMCGSPIPTPLSARSSGSASCASGLPSSCASALRAGVEAALDRALACGLVDDGRFADVLVRSRLAQGRGRRGIAAELESLGIDADGVEALAAADDDAGEVDRALALLDRKPPRAKNRRDAAYRRLAQKGFSASVSSSAARLWCEANPVEG